MGHIVAQGHPNGGCFRQLHCTVCGKYFVESTGTIFYRSPLAPEVLSRIVTALAEGVNRQATARIFEVDPTTVKTCLVRAYATYFFTFATMVGKRDLWLDDLYIDPAFRGQGIGQALMAYLADMAIEHQCGRFEWMVLDWNEGAINFYRSLGATVLTDWRICRLDEAELPRVAGKLVIAQESDLTPPASRKTTEQQEKGRR